MTVRCITTVVGFTGTRHGMSHAQYEAITELIERALRDGSCLAHHGDCLGADAQFDLICETFGVHRTVHPPTNPKLRAWCQGERILKPLPYLVRNKEIVRCSTLMFATPQSMNESQRSSGTWSTIRHAEEVGVPCIIVYPDGLAVRRVS